MTIIALSLIAWACCCAAYFFVREVCRVHDVRKRRSVRSCRRGVRVVRHFGASRI